MPLGEKRQARGLHGCAREECLGDLGPVVSGKGSDLSLDDEGRPGGRLYCENRIIVLGVERSVLD